MKAKFNWKYVDQRRDEGATWKEIAQEYGTTAKSLSTSYLQSKVTRTRMTPSVTQPTSKMPVVGRPTHNINTEQGTATTVLYVPNAPKSPQEHAKEFGMDMEVWELLGLKTNNWQGWAVIEGTPTVCDLYQITARWRIRPGIETLKSIVDRIVDRKKPPVASTKRKPFKAAGSGVLALNVPDLHLGKLCWPRECGDSPYDIGIAMKTFASCIMDLCDKHKASGHADPAVILLPIGNDFLNSDGPVAGKGAYTAAGTQQDEDGRWQKSFERGLFAVLDAVASIRNRFPKSEIRIPIVPGNHDETRIFYLGVALKIEFRGDARVAVDAEPTTRKFFDGLDYGIPVAIMWTHGHREKQTTYPALLSHRFDLRQYASKEVHTGHLHSQRGVSFDTYREVENLLLRQFPSLSPADSWHANQGYVLSQKCAQSVYYNEQGYAETIQNHYPNL